MGGGAAESSAATASASSLSNECKSLWLGLCQHYLDRYLLDAALFYAERLYYEAEEDIASTNLLAQCYFRMGKVKQTYLILQQRLGGAWVGGGAGTARSAEVSSSNRYLFAVACVALEKFQEAESTLLSHFAGTGAAAGSLIPLAAASAVPGGAVGVYLLGRICRLQHRKEAAIHYFKIALQV